MKKNLKNLTPTLKITQFNTKSIKMKQKKEKLLKLSNKKSETKLLRDMEIEMKFLQARQTYQTEKMFMIRITQSSQTRLQPLSLKMKQMRHSKNILKNGYILQIRIWVENLWIINFLELTHFMEIEIQMHTKDLWIGKSLFGDQLMS